MPLTGPAPPRRSVCARRDGCFIVSQTSSRKEKHYVVLFLAAKLETLRAAPSFRRRSRSFRPLLETLEVRTLLSTYVVNSPTDTGTGSGLTGDIRYCITQADQPANAGSTITFDTATTGGTITLSHGQLAISDNMTISGPRASSLTISGNNSSRLFDVASGGSLSLQNVTLSAGMAYGTGTAAEGGAIYSSGTLALSGVTVNGNEALGSNGATGQPSPGANAFGGGIYVAAGTATLINDILSSNSAVGGNGGNGDGTGSGGVGPGGRGGAGSGGGVYLAAGSLTLTNDILSSNRAGGGNAGNGGGGSIVYSNSGTRASAIAAARVVAVACTQRQAPSR